MVIYSPSGLEGVGAAHTSFCKYGVIVAVKLILCVRKAFFLLSIIESVLDVLKA